MWTTSDPRVGVAVLLKIYAHCIDGQADAASKRITDALYIALDQWLKTDTDRSIDALALEALAAPSPRTLRDVSARRYG